ncbi:MAG: penicillin-binding protein 1A [Bacteriovoracaceae bacterium]|jgi:penicillin-binding protein 1A
MSKSILYKAFGVLVALGVIGGVFGVSIIVYFSFTLPKISSLNDYAPPITTQILSKDGTVLANLSKEKREIVELDDVPPLIIDAFLSAEDSQFYEHQGVDYLGVARAMVANIKAGKVVQGGSTITQQVAKSLLLSHERSFTRKIKDFLLAQRIEKKLSKKEILYLYLNQVYLGGGYYGVKTAFKGYFGKELSEATVAEAAMVAGLLVAPGKYSPYINPSRAKTRQGYVLSRMKANQKISEEDYKQAIEEKIKYRLRKSSYFKAGYFTDWVRQRIIEKVGEKNFLENGFRVVTTLDWELQKIAEKEIQEGAKAIDKRQGFKGPLSHLDSDEAMREFFKKQREEHYSDNSNFFEVGEDYNKVFELNFDPNEINAVEERVNSIKEKVSYKRFEPGYSKDDPFLQQIKEDENYKAVVLKVLDPERVVIVSIAGVTALMGYEQFNWAHERIIQEERHFYPYVTRPSTILKRGDVVLVKVLKKKVSLQETMTKASFDKRLKSHKDYKVIKKEKYLLCLLDQEPDAQAALVSITPSNGEIISFVGGYDFGKSQFNRAIQSQRQPGSSFKPLLFAAGLENGYTPATIIIDSPEALGGYDASLNWKPRNYDGKFKGPITFRNSLEQSRNIPTIKIAEKLGVEKVVDFVDRIGFKASLDKDLSLALGSFGVTLMDMVTTYGIFPNGGRLIKAKSILSVTDRYGETYLFEQDEIPAEKKPEEEEVVVVQPTPEVTPDLVVAEGEEAKTEEPKIKVNPFLEGLGPVQVYDERLAYIMSNILKGVVLNGTGRGAKSVSHYLGGKTGTTNSYVDAWFTGFSSNVVTGVWTGFDDNKTLGWGETGAKSALPIWKNYMAAALKRFGEHDFKPPLGIVNVLIDKDTGRVSKASNSRSFMEAFVEGTEPGRQEEEKLDTEGSNQNTQFFEEDDYYNNQ